MSEFDYDSDDFDINFDDPGETTSRNADVIEPMNITPGRIEVNDNENNTGQGSQIRVSASLIFQGPVQIEFPIFQD